MNAPSRDDAIQAFWERARSRARLTSVPGYFGPTPIELVQPPAWSFGATPEQADELLALVLSQVKTATSSARDDYGDEPLPQVGDLGIVTDSAGAPQALIATTEVRVVPFDRVDAEHARREGEGDGSLESWRADHERFFAAHSDGGFRPDMPVVLERFVLLHRAED